MKIGEGSGITGVGEQKHADDVGTPKPVSKPRDTVKSKGVLGGLDTQHTPHIASGTVGTKLRFGAKLPETAEAKSSSPLSRKGPSEAEATHQSGGHTVPTMQRIRDMISTAVTTPGCQMAVFGYSPRSPNTEHQRPAFGASQSDPMLAMIQRTLDSGKLPPGSVAVLHVPEQMLRPPQSMALKAAIGKLQERRVNVVVAQVDKSVYGVLGDDGDGKL